MDIQFSGRFEQDITKPIKKKFCGSACFTGDNLSDTISIELTENGQPVTPGGLVLCTVMRLDGATVPVENGSINGNVVSVTLIESCFIVAGPITVTVKLQSNGITTTILQAVYMVEPTTTGTIIDPGTILPDINTLIAMIEAAVDSIPADYSDLLTTIAPDFSPSENYGVGRYVWYSGDLYKFKDAHSAGIWTGTDVESAVITADIYTLKNLIDKKPDVTTSNATGVDLDISDGNGNVVARLKDGHIQTKEFDSRDMAGKVDVAQGVANAGRAMIVGSDGNLAAADIPQVDVDATLTQSGEAADAQAAGNAIRGLNSDLNKAPKLMDSTSPGIDMDVTDSSGNVIMRLKDGHIKTKNFDSESLIDTSNTAPVVLSSSDGLNIVTGEYCDPQTGIIYDGSAYASFVRSDYLPVTPGAIIRATWCRHYILYNASKTYIGGGDISSLPGYTGSQEENFVQIPNGAAYLIMNYYVSYGTYAVTLEGKGDPEIVILGDSIYGIAPYPFNPVYYAAARMEKNIADCAFGGTTASVHYSSDYDKFSFHNIADCIAAGNFTSMADFSGMPAIFKQHRAILASIDWTKVKVVCLAWCTNDWDFSCTLDDSQTPKSTSTFMGALRYGMEKIWTVYPQIQFVLFGALYKTVTNDTGHDTDSAVVNGKTLQDFIDGMKSVADEYHQNFFDHYNIGFNSINASVVFRSDGVHLSYDTGAGILGNRTAKELEYIDW